MTGRLRGVHHRLGLTQCGEVCDRARREVVPEAPEVAGGRAAEEEAGRTPAVLLVDEAHPPSVVVREEALDLEAHPVEIGLMARCARAPHLSPSPRSTAPAVRPAAAAPPRSRLRYSSLRSGPLPPPHPRSTAASSRPAAAAPPRSRTSRGAFCAHQADARPQALPWRRSCPLVAPVHSPSSKVTSPLTMMLR